MTSRRSRSTHSERLPGSALKGTDETGATRCDQRAARAALRSDWPIRRYDLGAEPPDDLSLETTASERLAMVWPLTVLSWRLAGRAIPDYERCEAPGRIVRSNVLP